MQPFRNPIRAGATVADTALALGAGDAFAADVAADAARFPARVRVGRAARRAQPAGGRVGVAARRGTLLEPRGRVGALPFGRRVRAAAAGPRAPGRFPPARPGVAVPLRATRQGGLDGAGEGRGKRRVPGGLGDGHRVALGRLVVCHVHQHIRVHVAESVPFKLIRL